MEKMFVKMVQKIEIFYKGIASEYLIPTVIKISKKGLRFLEIPVYFNIILVEL